MLSPLCIIVKALFISSRGIVWVINDLFVFFHPYTSPLFLERQFRPSCRNLLNPNGSAKCSPFPRSSCYQLKWTGRAISCPAPPAIVKAPIRDMYFSIHIPVHYFGSTASAFLIMLTFPIHSNCNQLHIG